MIDFREGFRRLSMVVSLFAVGFALGYQWPRDVELESTKPVQFNYEITPAAARELILRSVTGCPTG